MKQINKIYLLISLLIVVFIIFLVYYYTEQSDIYADKKLITRDIDTTAKMWLNGYLGSIFRFKYSGTINWLVIPISIFFILNNKLNNISTEKIAILVFLLLAFTLISIKGFFNYRYQFTLVPVFIFLVFTLVWSIFRSYNKNILYAIAFTLALFNIGNLLRYAPYKKTIEKALFSDFSIKNNKTKPFISTNTPFVKNIYEYIDTMKTDKLFLVNNLPGFYYYTSKKGLYYWSGSDLLYESTGPKTLFNKKPDSLIIRELKEVYQCQFILTAKSYYGYNESFDQFISKYCKLICVEPLYELYRIE